VAKAAFTVDLGHAIEDAQDLQAIYRAPRKAIGNLIADLQEVAAVLETIEAYKPGLLASLEAHALEELQVIHDDPPPEIIDLIGRYVGRVTR
jgi:hypothetical protein